MNGQTIGPMCENRPFDLIKTDQYPSDTDYPTDNLPDGDNSSLLCGKRPVSVSP